MSHHLPGTDQGRIHIDTAGSQDIQRLIDIDKAASALFAPTGLLSEEALLDHVPHDAFMEASAAGLLWVARIEGQGPVGFCLASRRDDEIYIDQISVDPAYGRRGIGRSLMMHAEARALAEGVGALTLSTFRDLAWNGPFYASLGFKPIRRSRLTPFMQEVEREQAAHMDVSKRIFMRKRLRKRGVLGRKRI